MTVDVQDGNNWTYYNLTYFTTPAPVSVLGCTNQYQWCNPTLGHDPERSCTVMFGGHRPRNLSAINVSYSPRQEALRVRIADNLLFSVLATGVSGLGEDALLTSSLADSNEASTTVPDDQWIRELDHWFGIQFAALQLHMVGDATGTGRESWDNYLTRFSSENAEWMCSAQMMQRNDYASFSMLGIILILVFGLLAVVLNTALEPLVRLLQPEKGNRVLANAWQKHYLLQLQGSLYESLGMGTWNSDDQVPVTTDNAKFGLPTVWGSKHGDQVEESSVDKPESGLIENGRADTKAHSAESTYLLDVPLPEHPIVWSNDIGRA